MKIPNEVIINRERWDIVSEVVDSRWGCVEYAALKIGIKSDLTARQALSTLCHEFVHVFLRETGMVEEGKLNTDSLEGMCDAIGGQLASFLEDNCEWLVEIEVPVREYLEGKEY